MATPVLAYRSPFADSLDTVAKSETWRSSRLSMPTVSQPLHEATITVQSKFYLNRSPSSFTSFPRIICHDPSIKYSSVLALYLLPMSTTTVYTHPIHLKLETIKCQIERRQCLMEIVRLETRDDGKSSQAKKLEIFLTKLGWD